MSIFYVYVIKNKKKILEEIKEIWYNIFNKNIKK